MFVLALNYDPAEGRIGEDDRIVRQPNLMIVIDNTAIRQLNLLFVDFNPRRSNKNFATRYGLPRLKASFLQFFLWSLAIRQLTTSRISENYFGNPVKQPTCLSPYPPTKNAFS